MRLREHMIWLTKEDLKIIKDSIEFADNETYGKIKHKKLYGKIKNTLNIKEDKLDELIVSSSDG